METNIFRWKDKKNVLIAETDSDQQHKMVRLCTLIVPIAEVPEQYPCPIRPHAANVEAVDTTGRNPILLLAICVADGDILLQGVPSVREKVVILALRAMGMQKLNKNANPVGEKVMYM